VLSAGHARALLGVEEPDAQERLAHRIVAEGLSVRAIEEIVAMGGPETAAEPRRLVNRPTAPGLADLAARLSDQLETRVRIQMGRTRGKVIIDFATLDDLDRIVAAVEGRSRAIGSE
jgi:ParB family chromosome partitioning protein